LGKRYTEQEKQSIQELADQDHADESIAQQLGRSTNAIRNYRHRTNIKTRETRSIRQLKHKTQELDKKRIKLENRIDSLRKTRQIEEEQFHQRLENELIRLKDQKPELFTITLQEQITKLNAHLASTFLRWLIE
jgi:hypothetical protein